MSISNIWPFVFLYLRSVYMGLLPISKWDCLSLFFPFNSLYVVDIISLSEEYLPNISFILRIVLILLTISPAEPFSLM